ncbi:TELO2-interacting protein 2 [Rhinophrynus dorsalis]
MEAQKHLIEQALTELSLCLGRASIPQNPTGCAELIREVVAWAAPGPEPVNEQKVPEKAAAAARAFLRLLEALRSSLRDGTVAETLSICSGAGPPTNEIRKENVYGSAGAGLQCTRDESGPSKEDISVSQEDYVAVGTEDESPLLGEEPGTSLVPPGSSCLGSIDPHRILHCAAAPLVVLCGAHSEDRPWTDAKSQDLTDKLLHSLLEVSDCHTLADLLRGPRDQDPPFGTFREALGLLIPRLRKDTWESHPDAKFVFSWMLYHVTRPWLSEFLSIVMPPSLLFSDDYKLENKVLGIHCLHHIIKNVPAADLRQYNRAQVIYHALRNHLYTTDVEVIEVVLPCLLDLFPVLQKSSPALGEYQKEGENPSDQIMQLVLTHMEMEHKIALRRVYSRNLPALQEWLGVRVARHMKRLLRVIVGYLEVYDGPEEVARLCILETLQGTIKHAWPRIPCRLPLLLKALVKLIYDISCDTCQNPEHVTTALLHSATECLLLLDRCSMGQVKPALEGIPSICTDARVIQCIRKVQEDT